MPYIQKNQRIEIDELVDKLAEFIFSTPGEANYAITRLLHKIILKTELSYTMLNGVVGVLECVKLELYQQIARKYEDQKKLENGPVSELDKEKE